MTTLQRFEPKRSVGTGPEGWRGALEKIAGSVQDEVLQESARVGQARPCRRQIPLVLENDVRARDTKTLAPTQCLKFDQECTAHHIRFGLVREANRG